MSLGGERRPEGWEVPIAGALAEPVMIAGLPREYAILNGTVAAAIGLGLKLWWLGILWWVAAHAIGAYAARADKRFLDVLRRHLKLPAHLDC